MSEILKITNVSKIYNNKFQALDNLSLKIKKGEIFALLGPNGAGKSTLINTVCGILNFDSGNITVDELDIKKTTISNFKDNDFYNNYEYIIEFENYYQSFSAWIKTKNIKTIGLPYVPTGNWKKIYKKLINKNPSINFVYLHRKYDKQAWKFANKGFFNFKKHIPELISKL